MNRPPLPVTAMTPGTVPPITPTGRTTNRSPMTRTPPMTITPPPTPM